MFSLRNSSIDEKINDQYLVDISNFEKGAHIDAGGCGRVFLIKNKETGELFAAKRNYIKNDSVNELYTKREIKIMSEIQHPTIVPFRGYSPFDFNGDKNMIIIMDYMKEGNLMKLIYNEAGAMCPKNYDNTKRQIILTGIARGMMLLHSRHVIHRDLKPGNVLLDSDFHPYITDFGLSKYFNSKNANSQSFANIGTSFYMAPEKIKSNHFDTKADVYAFGILMYEVIKGGPAFPINLTDYIIKSKILDGIRPKFDFPIKKGLQLMIEKCWSQNPTDRPTFEELFLKLSLSSEYYDLQNEKIIYNEKEEEMEPINDDEAGFIESKTYCLENVDIFELLDYVDKIKNDPIGIKEENLKEEEINQKNEEIKELRELINKMASEISVLRDKVEKFADKDPNKIVESISVTSQLESLDKKISDQEAEIALLERKIIDINNEKNEEIDSLRAEIEEMKNETSKQPLPVQRLFETFLSVEPNLETSGILCELNNRKKNPFDKPFVASQSSNDICNILLPDSKDYFSTSKYGNFNIEFDLESEIMINGFQIFSAHKYFPKSFDVIIEGNTVLSVKEANDLNGNGQSMKFDIMPPVLGRKVRFIQTGPNWDKGDEYLFIKRIELFSTDTRYKNGVFATLISENISQDPHKCPVIISASCFDFNHFYSLDSEYNIWTHNQENQWFQVEFTQGAAILKGFRLRRTNPSKLRSYKIICTDDSSNPENLWTKLFEINEQAENEHKNLEIYKFNIQSPPIKYVRLVSTGPNWANCLNLKLWHFDLFGTYI